jgi:hypothetical protein
LCAARQESSGPVPSAPVVQTRRLTRDSSESELKQEILVFDKEFLFPEIDDTAHAVHTEKVTGRNGAYNLLEAFFSRFFCRTNSTTVFLNSQLPVLSVVNTVEAACAFFSGVFELPLPLPVTS